jgi:hypothetical protein
VGRKSKKRSLADLLPGVGGDRPLCKDCGKRWPWARMRSRYAKNKHGEMMREWLCPFKHLVGVQNMDDLAIYQEVQDS